MTAEGSREITGLIAAYGNGDEEALNRVVPLFTPSSGESRGGIWPAAPPAIGSTLTGTKS